MRHAMEPSPQRVRVLERSRFAEQDQKHRLKCVLGGVEIAQNTAAYRRDHRSIATHQRLEGDRVVAIQKAGEQLAIGQAGSRSRQAPETCFIGPDEPDARRPENPSPESSTWLWNRATTSK